MCKPREAAKFAGYLGILALSINPYQAQVLRRHHAPLQGFWEGCCTIPEALH